VVLEPQKGDVILVDEMGFLAEFYELADWAFVGGGFGKGVHSTLEPACHGIPVFCGPSGAESFTEIQLLQEKEQLRVVHSSYELTQALGERPFGSSTVRPFQVDSLMGGTQEISSLLDEIVSPRRT